MKISKKALYILALSGMITFSNITISSAYSFKLNLYKYGIRHNDVNAIQNKLKEKGYLSISNTTNYYGPMTKSSVIKFQRESGLVVDGIAGKNTLGKLFDNSTVDRPSKNSESNTQNNVNSNIQKQTTANLNMRSGPSTNYGVKLTIPNGSKVNVLSQNGSWSYVDYNGNKGHVFNFYLASVSESTNSSDDHTPNRGSSASSGKAIALDWWSNAQHEVPRGATFIVEDYKTGIKFNMKRTYGTNHADVETLTKEDTQKMKQVWSGFSWARRPIIVHINGTKLIASMTAMPHAGRDDQPANKTVSNRSNGYGTGVNLDAVKGNGMDGHVDIHFLNSTRHSNNKQDSSHQNNINDLIKIFSR